MNQPKQRRTSSIAWFDARSVMLFAALAVGGVAVQAQTAPAQTTLPAQPSTTQEVIGGGAPTPAATAPSQQPSLRPATPATSTLPSANAQQPSHPAAGMDPKREAQIGPAAEKSKRKSQ